MMYSGAFGSVLTFVFHKKIENNNIVTNVVTLLGSENQISSTFHW